MTSEQRTLHKALLNAADALGLSADELGIVLGLDIKKVDSGGLDPSSPAGLRALLLIRIYVRLYALVGDSTEDAQHWMHTVNRGFGAVPAELINSLPGLERVAEYLDALPSTA